MRPCKEREADGMTWEVLEENSLEIIRGFQCYDIPIFLKLPNSFCFYVLVAFIPTNTSCPLQAFCGARFYRRGHGSVITSSSAEGLQKSLA